MFISVYLDIFLVSSDHMVLKDSLKDGTSRSRSIDQKNFQDIKCPTEHCEGHCEEVEKTDTPVRLPETVCPSKIDQETRRNLIREADETYGNIKGAALSTDHLLCVVFNTRVDYEIGCIDETLSHG